MLGPPCQARLSGKVDMRCLPLQKGLLAKVSLAASLSAPLCYRSKAMQEVGVLFAIVVLHNMAKINWTLPP